MVPCIFSCVYARACKRPHPSEKHDTLPLGLAKVEPLGQ
jgi:hypothetical protein